VIIIAADEMARAVRYLIGIEGAAERAMSRALNASAVAGREEAVEAITGRYAARAEDVREMMHLVPSTVKSLETAIRARSGSLSVGYFPHRPSQPGTGGRGKPVLRAEIKRGQAKDFPGAFVAPLSSGNRVMTRTGKKTRAGRAAMRSLYTIPLANMLGVPSVRIAVEEKALEVLGERLTVEIDRELAKAGAA
jgi:hypothetical protein